MFHILHSPIAPPCEFTNPFCYEPHPLTLLAAEQLCAYLSLRAEWSSEISCGKMFGVLVCRDSVGRLGFLAAYSGQIGGRGDWPWFVPAVFDYQQPAGHFKAEESRISSLNAAVEAIEGSADYRRLSGELQRVREEGARAVASYKAFMQGCKQRRDSLRASGSHDEAALIGESQHQKAELRRLKRHWQAEAERVGASLRPLMEEAGRLRRERHERSDALQQWLFDHFTLLNAAGERRSLTDIFAATPQRQPPSGAGECCAPKLLHYAFEHHLQPLCMGELWQGRSPKMEVRHHGQFYPACRGKCKPILEWMLGRTYTDAGMAAARRLPELAAALRVVYADDHLIVVSKPSGLLSVPGRQGLPSVESLLGERYGQVFMAHRLDQDTSGLLVVARTPEVYRHLQRQFFERRVEKTYEALLVAPPGADVPREGVVSLPLRPDMSDRPRQLVDRQGGKEAVTHYEVKGTSADGLLRVALTPKTGRTHQLRVHCAHGDGLGMAIAGDALYGHADSGERLCLHARRLAFEHPATGQWLVFTDDTPF